MRQLSNGTIRPLGGPVQPSRPEPSLARATDGRQRVYPSCPLMRAAAHWPEYGPGCGRASSIRWAVDVA